jgi:hydroxymethylpyrimidine pyrophosphatase-like HAD family hydrolase
MGNAVQSVKDIANHTTQTSDEDGVAHAIDRFILDC